MRDEFEVESREARPPRSTGLTLVGLLVGAVVAAVLLGQLTSPDPAPRRPNVVVTIDDSELRTPEPDRPIGVDSIKRCPVELGGLILGDHLKVRGFALERWDCDGLKGPWSVVIRAANGHFGVKSAVVTFPFELKGSGVPSTKPQGGVWNPAAQRLIWPLGSSHAQIIGDLGQTTLENLAAHITVDRLDTGEDAKPSLSPLDGFTASATMTYRSPVVHEMRYGTAALGQEGKLGDGLVYTGVMRSGSFESQALESHGRPAGFVRGKPAIYSQVRGGNATLAWESAPGEVTYIGFSGRATEADAINTLRALADRGRVLTPAQWQTKDRSPVGGQSG